MRYFLVLILVLSASAAQAAPANLTVLADSSLMLPLAQISRDYARETGTPLAIVVKSGDAAAQQIEQGLEAHLLLTANQPLIASLRDRGLIDVFSAKPFARTQLALVGSSDIEARTDFARHISFAAIMYAQPDLPVYVTPPSTHEGARAAALMKSGEYGTLLSQRAVTLDSHEEAVEKLHESPGLALLLATDALNDPSLKVLSIFDDATARPVNYEAVVLASESMEETRKFIAYLLSPKGQKIFARFGFQPPLAQ